MTVEAMTEIGGRRVVGQRDPFPGSSTMAKLMRRTNWTATPIGSPQTWPESLRTAVGICLESRFPIVLWWGPDLVLLYNDAYLPALGDKHPASLGQRGEECWSEIWPTIGPMLEGVMQQAEATWSDDLLLYLRRRGFAEECYFTFSYSPIREADGRVGGIFCAVNETTARVRSERRLALLSRLASPDPHDPLDAGVRAIDTISAASKDVTFAALYVRDDDRRLQDPLVGGSPVNAAWLATLGAAVRECAATGGTRWLELEGSPSGHAGPAIPDSQGDDLQGGAAREAPSGQPLLEVRVMPMADASGGPADVLVLGRNPTIARDDVYEAFFDLVATHVATVLAAARAHEAERRRADALAELDHAKTVFFTNVSHEFRTPLTLLDAPLRELADDPALRPDHAERIAIGLRAAGRLRRLVNTLLEFSRIEAGTARPQLEPVDGYEAASDVASVFRSAFERANLTLAVTGEPLDRAVIADPEMLERILLNLVSNALKFTAAGGIEVDVRARADEAVISVRDTGVGIAQADLGRIFDRFGRVETSWSRSREGSGIGLALASELARLQGGRLDVTSRAGVGTTFRLFLRLADERPRRPAVATAERAAFADEASGWVHVTPHVPPPPTLDGAHSGADDQQASRAAAPARSAARPEAPDATGSRDARPVGPDDARTTAARVLVVDDNADMSAYLAKILGRHWTVETAFDGLSGLAAILRDPPDLVLTDVMMPGIDGLELARRIRREERLATLPVVLLSARAGDEARSEGLAAGADEYILKPFTATDLVVRISTMLERERVRRAEADALRALVGRLQENERQLNLALRVKDEFLGMISHELRTPVTTIRGNAELLTSKGRRIDSSRQEEALKDIAAEADRLNRVIENLLLLARAGSDRLEEEPLLLHRLIDSIAADIRRQAPNRRIDVRCQRDLMVDANHGAVEQILKNLLSNALKYSAPGDAVTVRCVRDAGWVRIAVHDRGIGLDATELDRIFEPFYRAERTRHVSGVGIGLTVARRLADAVGGSLHANSTKRGSTFTLVLPELADDAAVEDVPRVEPADGLRASGADMDGAAAHEPPATA